MNTVLILGAGASCPYGFPSGYRLVDEILELLTRRTADFEGWGFSERQIGVFKDAILKSRPSAIDDLIVQRPEFLEIGKLSIVRALVQYERPDTMEKRDIDDDWYAYFFEHLRRLSSPLDILNFSFITFNYDRSLEYFLANATDGFYGPTEHPLKQAIRRIPIIHVHGHLGELPMDGGGVPYAPTNDKSLMMRMSTTLRLIEEETGSATLAAAQVLIQKAQKIRFLGFGYHESNLAKLEFETNRQKTVDVAGTAYGLTDPEKEKIYRSHRIAVDPKGGKILQFFRGGFPLD